MAGPSQQDINNQNELNAGLRDQQSITKEVVDLLGQLDPHVRNAVLSTANLTNESRNLNIEVREQLGLRQKQADGDRALVDIAKAINKEAEKNIVQLGQQNRISKEVEAREKTLADAARERAIASQNLTEDQLKSADKVLAAKQKVKELDEVVLGYESDLTKAAQDLITAQASGDAQAIADAQSRAEFAKNRLATHQDLLAVAENEFDTLLKTKDNEVQRIALAKEVEEQARKNLAVAREEEIIQGKINDSLGVAGNIIGGVAEAFPKFTKAFNLDKVNKDMAEFAQSQRGMASRTQTFIVGLKSLGANLSKTITDPTVIFSAFLSSYNKFAEANKEVRQLTGQTATNVDTFNTSLISSIDAAKTIGSLSKEIGINVNAAFSGETITAASELTNLLGVSEKSAANLALRAEAFGGSLKGADETMFSTVANFNKTNRSAVNVGQVMEDVGNSSDSLALSLGGSVEELTQAAAGAARLGLNLQQAEGIADKLLNFEQSIQDELEAELLTGKQINLETARQAALNNDIATLTEEIGNNTQIMEAFSSGNRIQQESIAKSLGMSKDEVAKMIFLKQKENGLTDEQASKAAGLNIEAAKRLSAQESIQKSIEKLTSALAPVLEKVADFIAIITNNSAGLIGTYTILGLALFPKLASAAGGFLGNIKESVTSARDLVSNIGQAIGNFRDAGKEGAGFFGKVKSMFKGGDKVEAASEVKDAASDVSDVAGKVGDTSDTLGGLNSKNIRKFFQDLAAGLRSMGSAKVLAGIGNMVLFAPAAVLSVAAIPFLSFMGLIKMPFLRSNFSGLGQGLTSMATALPGVVALALFGPAALLASLSLPFLIAMAVPGFGALISTGLTSLATGLTALGTAAATGLPFLAVGLLASIGAAMIPFAFSLQLVTPLIETFGNIFIKVFSALPPIISAVAEGVVTVFGGIGNLISTVAESLLSLASPEVALGLITLAPALAALGFSMYPLGAGLASLALSAGLLAAITGSSNPFGMFEQLAEYAPGIDMASSAIVKMTAALGELQSAIDGVDSEKLNDIMSPSLGGVVLGLGTAAIQGVTDTVNSIAGIFGEGEGGGENDAVVAELQAVKEILNQILEKEGSVVIDTSRAGTAFAMGTSRLQ